MSDRRSARPAAAVVGAAGFIGTALTRGLVAGGLQVAPFTRQVPFLTGSGRLAPEIEAAETVYWLATNVNPAVAEERPDLVAYDHDQFAAFLRGVEAMRRVPRLVLLSSGGTVYDPASAPPYREDSPTSATTAYAAAKLGLEEALRAADLTDAAKVVVRAANAYGPGQAARRGQGVIAHWLRAALVGDPLVLLGDRDTVRDYVYIDDLVDALVRLHTSAAHPPVVNVGSGERTTLGDLAGIVLRVVDYPALEFEVRSARTFDRPSTWLDIGLAVRELGWHPRVPIADGVASVWRYLRRHRHALAGGG